MLPKRWYLNFHHLWSLGFCLGLMPWAPGTWGSLLIFPFAWYLKRFDLITQLIVWLLLTIYSCISAGITARLFANKDPSCIVCDELVGGLLPCIFIDWQWQQLLLVFVLFRFFDITKIWPASAIDKFSSGTAIVLDDVVAGVYVLILVKYIVTLF